MPRLTHPRGVGAPSGLRVGRALRGHSLLVPTPSIHSRELEAVAKVKRIPVLPYQRTRAVLQGLKT
jgi:hypothetical protein